MKKCLKEGCIVYTTDGKRGIVLYSDGVYNIHFEYLTIKVNDYTNKLEYIFDKVYNLKTYEIAEIYNINDETRQLDLIWKRIEKINKEKLL